MIRAIKPKPCYTCPLLPTGQGFKYDVVPKKPKIWVVRENPSTADVTDDAEKIQMHREFWEADYLRPAGLTFSDIAISHVFRCRPKSDPTGPTRKKAEQCCRIYDGKSEGLSGRPAHGGIATANPNWYVVTFDPWQALDVPSRKLFIRRAFVLAAEWHNRGFVPCILMGEAALRIVWPSLLVQRTRDRECGFKSWVGHHWHTTGWPHSVPAETIEKSDLVQVNLIEAEAKKAFGSKGRYALKQLVVNT
jgi:hypothetical protein